MLIIIWVSSEFSPNVKKYFDHWSQNSVDIQRNEKNSIFNLYRWICLFLLDIINRERKRGERGTLDCRTDTTSLLATRVQRNSTSQIPLLWQSRFTEFSRSFIQVLQKIKLLFHKRILSNIEYVFFSNIHFGICFWGNFSWINWVFWNGSLSKLFTVWMHSLSLLNTKMAGNLCTYQPSTIKMQDRSLSFLSISHFVFFFSVTMWI